MWVARSSLDHVLLHILNLAITKNLRRQRCLYRASLDVTITRDVDGLSLLGLRISIFAKISVC